MNEKAQYVKSQGQTRDHTCYWPGCTKQVPPAMWGCKEHWYMLPKPIRDKIWAAYRPGQERRLDPSRAYLDAAHEALDWIYANHPVTTQDPNQGALGLPPPDEKPAVASDPALVQSRSPVDTAIAWGHLEVVGVDDNGQRIIRQTEAGREFLAMYRSWEERPA